MPNFDQNAKILITGGTGFVGSHLVEELSALKIANVHVTAFSDSPGFLANILSPDKIHRLDLTDEPATFALIKQLQPDYIFHLAGLAVVGGSFDKGKETIINNLELQLNLLEAIKQFSPASKTLIIGSGMEYDFIAYPTNKVNELQPLGPASPYGVSKVAQDLLALSYFYSYNLDIVRARPFNHIGERQTADFAIASFAKQIALIEKGQQKQIKVGNLDAIRDFTDVKDMVKAYILLMQKGEKGKVYNIGSGEGIKIQKVLGQLISLASQEIEVVVDQKLLRPLDINLAVADNKMITELGWQPTIPINDTLERILNYWRQNS